MFVIWRASGVQAALAGVALTGLGYSPVYPGLGVEAVRLAPAESHGVAMGTYTAFLKGRAIMPHVVVKLWPGKSEEQKQQLADAITRNVTAILHYGDESVSVAMEEVAADEWREKVYRPDIVERAAQLYKKPGYRM